MSGKSIWKTRLHNEYASFLDKPIQGMTIVSKNIEEDAEVWMINVRSEGTLYSGQQFELKLTLNKRYPLHPPDIKFVGPNMPKHPHVYSNGDIGLSTLTEGWQPSLTLNFLCREIMTMLNSCE